MLDRLLCFLTALAPSILSHFIAPGHQFRRPAGLFASPLFAASTSAEGFLIFRRFCRFFSHFYQLCCRKCFVCQASSQSYFSCEAVAYEFLIKLAVIAWSFCSLILFRSFPQWHSNHNVTTFHSSLRFLLHFHGSPSTLVAITGREQV